MRVKRGVRVMVHLLRAMNALALLACHTPALSLPILIFTHRTPHEVNVLHVPSSASISAPLCLSLLPFYSLLPTHPSLSFC